MNEAALEGRLLGGRYRVRRLLGAGGMGAVYEGVQEDLQRRVAIKVLLGSEKVDRDDLLRFRQEALTASQLGHPNIIQVTDFQAMPGEPPFLVMELVEGEPLRSLLERERTLPVPRATFITTQILTALAAAHGVGIIHRDIKPPNIFLTRTPVLADLVKVLDFGIAKAPQLAGGFRTGPGAILGTPAYMAPEQALGTEVDHRADLYAVGACLFEMLAGRRPFAGNTPGEILEKLVSTAAPPLLSVAPNVPPRLAQVVDRALSRGPKERFSSAMEMLGALSPWSPSSNDSPRGSFELPAETTRVPSFGAVSTSVTPRDAVASVTRGIATGTSGPPYTSVLPQSAPVRPSVPSSSSLQPPTPIGSHPVWPHGPAPKPAGASGGTVAAIVIAIVAVVCSIAGGIVYVGYPLLRRAIPESGAAPTSEIAFTNWLFAVTTGDLSGDGFEDVVSVIDIVKPGRKDTFPQLAAFDGKTGKRMWLSEFRADPPIYRPAFIVGTKVVLVEGPGTIRIHDGATGRSLHKVSVEGEPIDQMCVPPGSTSVAWFRRDRETSGSLLDLETGTTRSAPAPAGCALRPAHHKPTRASSAELSVDDEWRVPALVEGDIAVAALDSKRKSFVGFVPSTNQILWRKERPSRGDLPSAVVDLYQGRAYLARATSSESLTLECVDARTGARLWMTELEGADEVSYLTFGARGLYLQIFGDISVLDAATGKVLVRKFGE